MVRNLPDSKRRDTRSPPSERRNCIPAAPIGKNSCPPTLWEMRWAPLAGRGSLLRQVTNHPGLPHPGLLPIPLAARNHHPATASALLGQRNSVTKSLIARLPNIKTSHVGTRAASTPLTRKPTSPSASAACLHHYDLPLRGQGKSTARKILLRPQALTHVATLTPETSVARLQQVTSSMWQPPGPFSPTLLPATDILST